MNSPARSLRIHAAVAASLAALALMLARPARADDVRTGGEPWFRQASAEAQRRAQALFSQALEKHQQLLRGEAMELYEQALALWDNPDIRWDLALVLEDLGQYLRAYEQLEGAFRWAQALGAERLREVREHMRMLETQRLARIEAHSTEPGAEITLDGRPWFHGAGRQNKLVLPGEHYIAASKPGYFLVTRSVDVIAGKQAHVALQMDEDRLVETRRWTPWKPWAVFAGGLAVAAAGAGLHRLAFANREAAGDTLALGCPRLTCASSRLPAPYDRAKLENGLAIGALAAGTTVVAVGLALVWLNQPNVHRAEARAPSPIELGPILSPDQLGVSALTRF